MANRGIRDSGSRFDRQSSRFAHRGCRPAGARRLLLWAAAHILEQDSCMRTQNPSNSPELSFVVVAFHRPNSLQAMLRQISDPRIEVVVVNIEADPAVEAVARAAGVSVVKIDGNPGYAAGVNAGVTHTTTATVVFANDDVSCRPETLLALGKQIRDGDADVAVPRVLGVNGETVPTIQRLPSLGGFVLEWMLLPDRPVRLLQRVMRIEKWRHPVSAERVGAASAVVVGATRSLLDAVPLPEVYFLYWEESEWFTILARRGARVLYFPDLTVEHRGGSALIDAGKSVLLARNAIRCIRRVRGPTAARAAYLVGIGWNLRLLILAAIRMVSSRGAPGRSRLVFRARYAGLGAALRAWEETDEQSIS